MSKFKFTWGHGVMLALGSFMAFILTLIYLADVSGDLVTDDYYEHALVYQEEDLDAQNRAKHLAEKPKIESFHYGIMITFPKEIQAQEGEVYMMRGNFKKDDIKKSLELKNNQFFISETQLKPGEYDMELKWKANDSLYLIKKTIQWNMPSS